METMTSHRMDECDLDSNMSSTSSRAGGGGGGGANSSSMDKYVLKTLCFSRKSQAMPSKEEYTLLLSNGLGARKWQVSLNLNADEFRHAIFVIYPRLANTTGFTLWNVKKDKTFEKLPVKVNTPNRIRAYLGYQFTGCLIIMPLEEMLMVPSISTLTERREFLTDTDDQDSGYRSQTSLKYRQPFPSQSRPSATFSSNHRQFCIICRRISKQIGGGSNNFHDINKQRMTTEGGYATAAEKLAELLHINLPRMDLVASEDICRKCYRQLTEIDFLESQLKRSKAEFLNNFLLKLAASRPKETSTTSSSSEGCRRIPCDNFTPENLCVPQRVYLTPSAYRNTFERHGKTQNFTSRTLNVVPVRLNYSAAAATQLQSGESVSNNNNNKCFAGNAIDKVNSSIGRQELLEDRSSNNDEGITNSYDESRGEQEHQDRRDRWYKFEGETAAEVQDREHDGDHQCRETPPNTDENFEAAIVEAKRKGVARVEAFLDMMSYKIGSSAENSGEDNRASSNIAKEENDKNSSTSPSSQSPSPPTFSSSSPDETMNSLAINKISMARPRPWKKRHRHFDYEANMTEIQSSTNVGQGVNHNRGSKRDYESVRSPISPKVMKSNCNEHNEKLDISENNSRHNTRLSTDNLQSDEENTGSSFSSGSDTSVSSNGSNQHSNNN